MNFTIPRDVAHHRSVSGDLELDVATFPAGRQFPDAQNTSQFVLNGLAINGFEFTALTDVAVAQFTQGSNTQAASAFTVTVSWGDSVSTPGSEA